MTHHALLYEGTYEWALTALPSVSQKEGPDVVHLRGSRMGIDDARTLIEAAYQTPLVESERHFVLSFPEFTLEAQNALLKIVEEPPSTARIYIVTEHKGGLLPTLRSRLVDAARESEAVPSDGIFEDFLKFTYAERLAEISTRATKKDDAWMHMIMNGIEREAEKSEDVAVMRAVTDLRPYFGTAGASKKMILEHLSLLLKS